MARRQALAAMPVESRSVKNASASPSGGRMFAGQIVIRRVSAVRRLLAARRRQSFHRPLEWLSR